MLRAALSLHELSIQAELPPKLWRIRIPQNRTALPPELDDCTRMLQNVLRAKQHASSAHQDFDGLLSSCFELAAKSNFHPGAVLIGLHRVFGPNSYQHVPGEDHIADQLVHLVQDQQELALALRSMYPAVYTATPFCFCCHFSAQASFLAFSPAPSGIVSPWRPFGLNERSLGNLKDRINQALHAVLGRSNER